MWLIINSFVVFALTLIVTKSKILAGKREFVEQRFIASKINEEEPGWIHRWWHAIWTCPMCAGFWIAIPICLIYPVFGLFVDVLVIFGANWLLHCLENLLFFTGKLAEDLDNASIPELISRTTDIAKKAKDANLIRLLEKKLKKKLDSDR